MKEINKELALKAFKERIKEFNKEELMQDLIELFLMLSDSKMVDYLQIKGINYLFNNGIDEAKLKDVIDKINELEYYIRAREIYANNSLDDCDYIYSDIFKIMPILEEAVEYCFNLFGQKDYINFLRIGKELVSLRISIHYYSEYDDYIYGETYPLEDCFSCLDYSIDFNKLKDQVFSVILDNEYNYEDIMLILNTFDYYQPQDIEKALSYATNKSKCLNNLKEALKENLKKDKIQLILLQSLLITINDEQLFKLYAYQYMPLSLDLFDLYYDYLQENKLDISAVVKDIIQLFPIDIHVEQYVKMAVSLEPLNDDYKIMLYCSNPSNINNYFELYRIDNKTNILTFLKKDLHFALTTLDMEYVLKLNIFDLLCFLEYLAGKNDISNEDERTIENINYWYNSLTINNNYLNDLYVHAIDELTNLCHEKLGVDRKFYDTLANLIYRLDCLKPGVLHAFYNAYSKYYSAFKRELEKVMKK